MLFQTVLLFSLALLEFNCFENNLQKNYDQVNASNHFSSWELKWSDWISYHELHDNQDQTGTTISKLSKIYFLDTSAANTFAEVSFNIYDYADNDSMSTYFFNMEEDANQGTNFTKYFNNRFIFTMGISQKIKTINIDFSNNKCIHFFAFLTTDPDLHGEVYQYQAFVNLKIKNAPELKKRLQNYTREENHYELSIENPNETSGVQYLRILCPFFRKNVDSNSKLFITFTQHPTNEEEKPGDGNDGGSTTSPINGRKGKKINQKCSNSKTKMRRRC